MGTYAAESDVQARIPSRTISASTKPSSTDVALYITDAESRLTGALKAGQIATPITDSDGVEIMTGWVATYAEGRCRMAWAAGAGDGDNDDGKDMVQWFVEVLIPDIINNPSTYEAMLTGGAATSSSRVRSYTLDNNDDKTIADGDFDPQFASDTAPEDQL